MDQYYLICAYIISGLLGLCVGSFLNVVIYRIPRGISLCYPASRCNVCGYRLRWYDNIPILSWLILGGRCRSCRKAISKRYIIVEFGNTALWLISMALFWGESPVYAVISALVCSVLICIFFIDLEHMLIYNRFAIIMAILGFAAMFFDRYTAVKDHVIGALAGGGLFALIYFGAILILKREAMGFADVKLAAAAGLFLGWQKLILSVLIGSVVGSFVLVILNRAKKQNRNTEYPLGPFITGGIIISLLAGERIIEWYISILLG